MDPGAAIITEPLPYQMTADNANCLCHSSVIKPLLRGVPLLAPLARVQMFGPPVST